MIRVTRLNGQALVVNAAHIMTVESTPDTVLGLQNGEKLMVRETAEEVVTMATYYFRDLGGAPKVMTVERLGD